MHQRTRMNLLDFGSQQHMDPDVCIFEGFFNICAVYHSLTHI